MSDDDQSGFWGVVKILGGFILVLALIGFVIQAGQKGWEAFRGTPSAPVAEKSPQPGPVPDRAKSGPPDSVEELEKPVKTSAQLLSEGKKLLAEKKIYEATVPLNQITHKHKEYSQAQALIKKAYALQKQDAAKLRQKEKEAERERTDQVILSATLLAGLSQKGLIQICPGDISAFVLVEPLWWKKLTHVRKQKTVQAMINVARTERKSPDFVIFQDMTSRETVAKGFVKSGEIKIYK